SGGLGPTTDDRTRQAVARFFSVETYEDPTALLQLTVRLKDRRRDLNGNNRRQAQLPVGADLIENRYGTAPCFSMHCSAPARSDSLKMVFSLPGIPSEFEKLIIESVLPALASKYEFSESRSRFRCTVFGMPESEVGEALEKIRFPREIDIAYQPRFPEIF